MTALEEKADVQGVPGRRLTVPPAGVDSNPRSTAGERRRVTRTNPRTGTVLALLAGAAFAGRRVQRFVPASSPKGRLLQQLADIPQGSKA